MELLEKDLSKDLLELPSTVGPAPEELPSTVGDLSTVKLLTNPSKVKQPEGSQSKFMQSKARQSNGNLIRTLLDLYMVLIRNL